MVRRLLAVAGLTGLVVAQPLLDLLGRSPSTFELYGFSGRVVFWFAALIVVVPPLALWLVAEGVRAVREDAGEILHLATVGLLLAGFGILLAKAVSGVTVLNLLIGVAVGAGGVVLYRRAEPMGMWLRLVAVANLAFFAQFVWFAPVADWAASAGQTAVALTPDFLPTTTAVGGTSDADPAPTGPPSVFVLILDELPTWSLMNADGEVDAVRYPTFAALADDATFYRRHTTISPFTHGAVPSLLDGKEPQGQPIWTDHPENLFSLFASSHHLVVSEVVTRMCGFETCGNDPIPPPPPSTTTPLAADGSIDATTTTTNPVPPADDGPDRRWRDLAAASWAVWTDRVSPAPSDKAQAFDDAEEQIGEARALVSTTTTTRTTTTVAAGPTTTAGAPATTVPPDISEEERMFAQFLDLQAVSQPDRLGTFLDAVRPSDRPLFGYLHLALPHQPWVVREDGTVYDVAADRRDVENDLRDPWAVQVARQRHILQTQYTDRVLGQFLAHLASLGLYDSSLIVVTGDHGVGLAPGAYTRGLADDTLAQIAFTPLFIKAPGQTTGVISDENLTLIDVAPTMAGVLGFDLPWDADGAAAGSAEVAARDATKHIYDIRDPSRLSFDEVITYDGDAAYETMLASRFRALNPGADAVSALWLDVPGADLVGADPDDVFGPIAGRAEVVELGRLQEPGDRPWLGELAGRAPGAPDDATVLVAVGDHIVGVSPLYTRREQDDSFVVLLPGDALAPTGNVVRLGLRTADGAVTELDVSG